MVVVVVVLEERGVLLRIVGTGITYIGTRKVVTIEVAASKATAGVAAEVLVDDQVTGFARHAKITTSRIAGNATAAALRKV